MEELVVDLLHTGGTPGVTEQDLVDEADDGDIDGEGGEGAGAE